MVYVPQHGYLVWPHPERIHLFWHSLDDPGLEYTHMGPIFSEEKGRGRERRVFVRGDRKRIALNRINKLIKKRNYNNFFSTIG